MKTFGEKEIKDALDYAEGGGQALHIFKNPAVYPGAPACFRMAKVAAHLLDRDLTRPKATAAGLGVQRIIVFYAGQRYQHVDICGRPLAQALSQSYGTIPDCATDLMAKFYTKTSSKRRAR